MSNIENKLSLLREKMIAKGLDMVIIPSNDPHFSEYTPEHWKCREFISGFTGSAGRVLVTLNQALLWSDSRYFIQAEEQLKGTSYIFMRENDKDYDSLESYIARSNEKRIAIDMRLISVSAYLTLKDSIANNILCDCGDIISDIWHDRSPLSSAPILSLTAEVTGETTISKINRVRESLDIAKHDSIYIISPLDWSAWLLNIRGVDIEYNPLNVCYSVIEKDCVRLFIKPEKVDSKTTKEFNILGIEIHSYDEFEDYLSFTKKENVILNFDFTSYKVFDILKKSNKIIHIEDNSHGVINHMKAIKNETEINGFKKSMIEDGVALTRFYIWLESTLKSGTHITEYDVVQQLCKLRSESPLYFSESFGSIVGFGANGAIVHYSPSSKNSATITPDNFLLIDSGAQYICGTTDITRTVHLGTPSKEQRVDFTAVLQGHIDLAAAIFPVNTRGVQLDFLARQYLCMNSMNYLHGTGHGVGHFLNVHEGPQSIRMNENSVVLRAGMVNSNEPAVYKTGRYGIRTENLILCKHHSTSEFGDFECFETITLCYIDVNSIEVSMLTQKQKEWLNNYHITVYNTLSQHLSPEENRWLKSKTENI